jgi:hypothetical protein
MTFCAFSSLILAEAMNLVRNSLFSVVGIESVIWNTKQMSCTTWPSAISRGGRKASARSHGKNGQQMATSGLKHREGRSWTSIVSMRYVNPMTVFALNTGTILTPPRA